MTTNLLWQQLEGRLELMIADFRGVAGVHVEDLSTEVSLSINGNELFPTASTIKIHILTQLMLKVEQGSLNLEEMIRVTPAMKTPGSGVIYYMQDDVELSLLNLAILMIIVSDNTATNLCIDLAGFSETNQLSRSLGLRETTLRRKMSDRRSIEENNENVDDTSSIEEEEEEEGLNVSLAAMEEKLKPKVLKDFDEITKLFKKLQKYSQELISADKKNQKNYISLEKKYKKIQKEMIISMKEVHFNSSTIEALMESL